MAFFFSLAFAAPILNVPLANRLATWACGLTKDFGDNNHKVVQLSNKYLANSEKMLEGLNKYNQKEQFAASPLEKLFRKLTGKPENNKIDISKLLEKCGDNTEVLRKRLIKSKNIVLCSDLIITGLTLGSLGFLNNYMTKKRTGKAGFSAELEMADSKIIADRTNKYEENKKKNALRILGIIAGISTIVPLAVHKGLTSTKNNSFNSFIKKHANWTDYTKGIFMSRFVMLMGMIMNASGLILASRNDTERKDAMIRTTMTNSVFLGGDILTGSLITGASDKLFNTELTEKTNKKGIIHKIFPKFKSLEKINEEVLLGKLSKGHKSLATGIYWGNLALCAGTLAYVVPAVCNKMIKKDVSEHVKKLENQNSPKAMPIKMEDFLKNGNSY